MPEIQVKTADGVIHKFPDGTPDLIIDRAIKSYVASQQQGQPSSGFEGQSISGVSQDWFSKAVQGLRSLLPASSSSFIDKLPQNATKQEFFSKSAPAIEAGVGLGATMGTAALGGSPALAGAAGSFAMPAVDEAIRNYLGQSPAQTHILPQMGSLGPILEQGTMNEIVGRASSIPLTSVGEKSFLDSSLGTRVKFEELLDSTAGRGLLQSANYQVIDKILNNPSDLQRFLNKGEININGKIIVSNNARKDAQGYVISKIFDKNTVNGISDVNAMLQDFTDFTKGKTGFQLFSNEQRKIYIDFLNSVKASMQPGVDASARKIRIDPLTKHIIFSGSIIAGRYAGLSYPEAFVVGSLSTPAIASILKNRTAANIFNNLIKGEPIGMSLAAGSRIIMNTLTQQPITMTDKNGIQIEGIIGANGQINMK